MVCNAGKASHGSVLDSSYMDTRRSLDVNVASHIGLIQMIVPKMIERQKILKTKLDESDNVSSANTSRRSRGRLVIVSSIAGQASSSKTSLYSASKAFLNTFAYVSTFFLRTAYTVLLSRWLGSEERTASPRNHCDVGSTGCHSRH